MHGEDTISTDKSSYDASRHEHGSDYRAVKTLRYRRRRTKKADVAGGMHQRRNKRWGW